MTDDIKQPRKLGKIVHVDKERGFGFISSPKDVPFTRIFFFWTALVPETITFLELEKDMEVEFELMDGPKGPKAIKIDVLENENKQEVLKEV